MTLPESHRITDAEEAAREFLLGLGFEPSDEYTDAAEKLAALITARENAAREAEREACAKIADKAAQDNDYSKSGPIQNRVRMARQIAAAIRSRLTAESTRNGTTDK